MDRIVRYGFFNSNEMHIQAKIAYEWLKPKGLFANGKGVLSIWRRNFTNFILIYLFGNIYINILKNYEKRNDEDGMEEISESSFSVPS